VQAVEEFVKELRKIQEEAEAALHKACDDMKRFADRTLRACAGSTRKGDQVWLSTKILILTDHRENWQRSKLGCTL